MNNTTPNPVSSVLQDWLVNHPKILHFSWNQGETLGSSPQFLTLTIVTYLSITYLLSSNPQFSLGPHILKRITTVHNIILIVFSAIMAMGGLLAIINAPNFKYVLCLPTNTPPSGPLFFWSYIFYLSKIYEYIDTLLIVLGKSANRLSFLHVYHHATVVLMCYVALLTSQSSFPVIIVTNCLVHVLMYYYYLLCSIGLKPKWKKLVTDCQLFQFGLSFISMSLLVYYHITGSGCSGLWGAGFSAVFITTLLALFMDFHVKNYSPSPAAAKIKGN